MTTVFVTASGTEVGKTFVMCALIEALRRTDCRLRVVKPIATGFDPDEPESSDTGRLLHAQGLPLTATQLDAVTPWRFSAALSPDMAAERERRRVPFDALLSFCRDSEGFDLTLIEGIGGVMVPLDERHTVRDWIAALGAPVLLVTGSYLGTLSHTLTAVETLEAVGSTPLAVIVSESPEQPAPLEETRRVLQRFLEPTAVVALPRNNGTEPVRPDLLSLLDPYVKEGLHRP